MPAGLFTIEFFEEQGGRRPVEDWMEADLTALELAALLSAFEYVLSHHGVNVCGTEWGEHLGDGLFEFRIRHSADEIRRMFGGESSTGPRAKVLLRVFCHAYGDKIVLLLNGYDKGGDVSTKRQQREIALARKRLAEFEQRRKRDRPSDPRRRRRKD